MIRRVAFWANTSGNPSIDGKQVKLASPDKYHYGGLWDYYDCWITVASMGYPDNEKAGFVDQIILSGKHTQMPLRIIKERQQN